LISLNKIQPALKAHNKECVPMPAGGRVAIIGASNNRAKFGNKAVRAFLRRGFTVLPVNPHETAVEGLPAFNSIADLPVRPDLVSVYVPPPVLVGLLPAIAARGCDELWLNPGTESEEVLALARRLGLHVIQGCGIIAVEHGGILRPKIRGTEPTPK
jgi:uncharacterized protein